MHFIGAVNFAQKSLDIGPLSCHAGGFRNLPPHVSSRALGSNPRRDPAHLSAKVSICSKVNS